MGRKCLGGGCKGAKGQKGERLTESICNFHILLEAKQK